MLKRSIEPSNQIEAFIQSNGFRYVFSGLLALLALAMLVSFFTASWVEVNVAQFYDEKVTIDCCILGTGDEDVQEKLATLHPLIRAEIEADSESISLSAWELLRGSSEDVPTLDVTRATAGKTDVRFVDKFLWFIPFSSLLLLGFIGFYAVERLNGQTFFLLSLVLSIFIFLFSGLWESFSVLDWQGYEEIAGLRRQADRQLLSDTLTGFYSTNEQYLLGILLLVVSFIGWLTTYLYEQGYLRREFYTQLSEDAPRYFQSKSITDYLSTVILLAGIVVIFSWFQPLAQESTGKFYQLTYQGLSDGFLLALIALGLVLIYKSTDVINFAHGELMMLGAYLFAEIILRYKFSLPLSLLISALLLIPVGLIVERLILRPLIGEPIISVIMVTIGLSNVLNALVGLQWKNQALTWQEDGTQLEEGVLPLFSRLIPKDTGLYNELVSGNYQYFEAGQRLPYSFKYDNIYLAIVAIVFIFILIALFKYSKHGVAMRATADDQQAALSMGISVKQIFAIVWGSAAILAGVAGVLLGDIGTGANIDMPSKSLRAFPVIILGGLDSIVGAVIGGLIIGLLENYAVGYLDPWLKENVAVIVPAASTKEVISYLVLIVILMFRPYGLFGKEVIERV